MQHIEASCNIIIRSPLSLSKCPRSAYCKKWGLKPFGIYEQITIPTISYGIIVWSHGLESKKYLLKLLTRVQCSTILLGARKIISTNTCHLNNLAGILPLDLKIRQIAVKTYPRLYLGATWTNGFLDAKLTSHAFN